MTCLKHFRWVIVFLLAVSTASAQEADTLVISGTFRPVDYVDPGMLGVDLAEVNANGYEHVWTLTLHGVTYSHDYVNGEWSYDEWTYGLFEEFYTRVDATSFEFQFFGPDADILNEVVSSQLTGGGLEFVHGEYFNSNTGEGDGPYGTWGLGLYGSAGVSFFSNNFFAYSLFSTDEYGYPLVEPQRLEPVYSTITDHRPGNSGRLFSGGFVDIGSSEPPVLPPPPPPPPTLSISDGSVLEGNSGTTRLDLTVTLSRSDTNIVAVQYATSSGTALGSRTTRRQVGR